MGVPIGAIIAMTAAVAANNRKKLEIQKQLNLINQKENPTMECYNHTEKKVVGICGSCYKAICRDCSSPGCKILMCRNCNEKITKANDSAVLFLLSLFFGALIAILFFSLS